MASGAKSKEPRVVHVVPALFRADLGIIGGAERYVLELARHMAPITPTRLVAFGDRDHHEVIGDLHVHVIGNPWFVRNQRTNPFSVRAFGMLRFADVVHCHQRYVLTSSLMAAACRVTGRRVVVTDLGGGGWDISGYVSTERWFHRHLHISQYSRDVAGQASVPWAEVISGGVDTAKFTMRRSAPRDGPVVFVGRLFEHKGVHDLICALPSGASLEIIGRAYDPGYYQYLKDLARGKPVVFRHEFGDAELIDAYHRAVCVVLPSVYSRPFGGRTLVPELLGQTLLEGMACGVPVICTDVASMPEVVQDGVTGWIVPPNDPVRLGERIQWLRAHPDEAAEMGRAGRRRVGTRFTWDSVVQRCLAAYTSESRSSHSSPSER